MAVQKQVLDNNTVLITEPIAEVKTAAIGFWFPVGSRDETDEYRGVTHFVEHMMFKGTGRRSAYDIAREFDRIGGYVNAFTEREMTCVYCVIPSRCTLSAAAILCDMITCSVFSEDDMERERAVIESEIISSLDDPEEAAFDAVFDAVWPGQSISQPISGTVGQLNAITRESALQWYSSRFASGFLTVTAAGNIDAAALRSVLEQLPVRTQLKPDMPVSVPCWHAGRRFIRADFQQSQVFILYPAVYPPGEDTYYTWSILNAVVGDTMSSRLFQRLRERGGYCYNVFSFFNMFRDCGMWGAYASSSKKNIEKVITDLRGELESVFEKGVSPGEIADAKEHLYGEQIIASEDTEYRMKRLARQYFYGFPLHTVEEAVMRIQSIPSERLLCALDSLFVRDRETVILYGPSVKKLRLEDI